MQAAYHGYMNPWKKAVKSAGLQSLHVGSHDRVAEIGRQVDSRSRSNPNSDQAIVKSWWIKVKYLAVWKWCRLRLCMHVLTELRSEGDACYGYWTSGNSMHMIVITAMYESQYTVDERKDY